MLEQSGVLILFLFYGLFHSFLFHRSSNFISFQQLPLSYPAGV
jgi:hypothetical protein